MKEKFITIVGFDSYFGKKMFRVGNLICCKKEPDNMYDAEAIRVVYAGDETIGYVANSYTTVAFGTMSGGRVYDTVKKMFYARVLFITNKQIICKVEYDDFKKLSNEYAKQCTDYKNLTANDEDEISF